MERRRLTPSTGKTMMMMMLSLGFTLIGGSMAQNGEAVGWLCMLFFGLGVVVFGIQMAPGACWLDLDDAGFTVCSLFKTQRHLWTDIQEFGIITIRHNRMVAFNFVQGSDRLKIGRRLSRAVAGYEGSLPNTYGLKAEALAKLMMQYMQNRTDTTSPDSLAAPSE
jgi:hypothetical protein